MKCLIEKCFVNYITEILNKNIMKDTQFKLYQEIVDVAKINMVTCGDCGDVVLHRMEEEEIKCPHCGFKSEPCDFPDLYYEEIEF
jgi:predicted RNA-binding Zn-ribbon protein involved in translation (DUF1610 family)